MDFNFRGFDSPRQYNPLFPTQSLSSVSRHAFFSDRPVTEVLPMGRSHLVDTRDAIEREIVKERIRSEILAEEIGRQCLRRDIMMERDTLVIHNNGGFASSYMVGPPPFSSHHNRFEHEINMHGGLFSRADIRRMWPREIHGGSDGSYSRNIGGFEMVPFQQGPQSSKMINTYQPKDEEIVTLGQSSLKRKLPRSPSPSPAGERSSEFWLDTSNKKMMDECQIRVTSDQGLNDHLDGNKHQSETEALNGSKKCGEIGLGNIKKSVNKRPRRTKNSSKRFSFDLKEDRKTERDNIKQKLKPWCRLCRVEAPDANAMIKHKKGKKHQKNLLKRDRA